MSRRQASTSSRGERRTRPRHHHGSSSRQQEAEPVPDLRYGYLVEHDEEEHARFMATFATRPICKPKSLDMAFFAREGLEIVPLLEASHLRRLAEMNCPYSEVMVRAFYHNLSYQDGDLRTRVCGVDILMTTEIWTELLGINFDRVRFIHYDGDNMTPLDDFNRDEAVHEVRRPGGHRAIFTVGQLTVDARVLFYVMTHILFPRAYNHSRVLEGDIPIMWAIRHARPVNWRHYICWMMYKAKQKANGHLPYPYLVQMILERFGVPMDTEVMVSQNMWNAMFGQRLLEQCKIFKGANGVWQYADVDEEVHEEVPVAPFVDPEVPDDDDHMEDIAQPEGGFSLADVMMRLDRMERKQKKRWKAETARWKTEDARWTTENARWIQMQARFKGIEDRLGGLDLGGGEAAGGDADQAADVPEEEEEEEEEDTESSDEV